MYEYVPRIVVTGGRGGMGGVYGVIYAQWQRGVFLG